MTESTLQERDRLPSRRIAIIGALSIVTMLAGICVSTAMLWGRTTVGSAPRTERPGTIGMVEQSAIESAHRAGDLQRAQRAALTRYRWIDGTHEVAEIPIDRAMTIIAEKNAR